jgi:GT2 family glycosyltransferase
MTVGTQGRIAAVILNWRRADDTIACIASVAALDYENLDIVVCDNDSQDGSIEKITAALTAMLPAINDARKCRNWRPFLIEDNALGGPLSPTINPKVQRLCLIQTGKNGGYAFGNNVGIRAAMKAADLEGVWILNNDTIVKPDALAALTSWVSADSTIGICGALVLYLNNPNIVQTLGGGRFLKWRARGEQLGTGIARDTLPDYADVEASLDYVNGAAAFITTRAIQSVGLMDEKYFLYFEEIDWATRVKAAGLRLGYCPQAIVYHKVGASTGTSDDATPSGSSIYYAEKSKFRFLRKYHPAILLIAIPLMLRAVGYHRLKGRHEEAKAMLCGAFALPLPHSLSVN